MFRINNDGGFELPAGADEDFTHFLESNGVACVGVGQIRSPFDAVKVQELYLEWVERQQRHNQRNIIIRLSLTLIVAVLATPLLIFLIILGPPHMSMLTDLFFERAFPPPNAARPVGSPGDSPITLPWEVDRILGSLNLGNIAYNIPSSIHCNERTTIQLLLSPRTTIEELKQKISSLAGKEGEKIRVADVMEARLYGRAFETHALRPDRQAVGEADDTEWQWEVVAREPGNQELHLVISAVLNVNGREGSKVLKVYERTINVHVTMIQMIGMTLADHWHWLVVVVGALGTIMFVYRRFPHVTAPELFVEKIKVLLFAANPRGTDPLDLQREFREIDEEIRLGRFRDALELIFVPGARLVDLLRKLNESHPNIVHFSGHGNIDEEIILESGEGALARSDSARSSPGRDMQPSEPMHEASASCSPKPLSKSALVDVLKACNEANIRIVVLNACHTRSQAEALCEVIDCAISMNRAISDVGAITFAASFYGALAFGRSVKNAFDQGLARLKAEGIPETETPELVVRAGVDASTLILVGPHNDAEASRDKIRRTVVDKARVRRASTLRRLLYIIATLLVALLVSFVIRRIIYVWSTWR